MLYPHGLPYSEKLGENIINLIKRIEDKKASLVLIDGGLGEGKTTLGVHIADQVNHYYGLPDINFSEQVALGGQDFTSKLRICFNKKLPVIVYDEAGDFNRRGALTAFNQMINRTFEMFRAYKIFVILCLPSFHVVDNDLFMKNIPRLLIHLRDRTAKQGSFSGYSLYRMLYVRSKMEKLVVKSFAYSLVDPNFYGHFLDLDPLRSKALDIYSIKGKKDNLIKSEIKLKGLYSYSDLSYKIGRSIKWCKNHANKEKINAVHTVNKVKYFNENQFHRLCQKLDEKGRKFKH